MIQIIITKVAYYERLVFFFFVEIAIYLSEAKKNVVLWWVKVSFYV